MSNAIMIESFSLNSRFKNLPEAFLGNGSSMNQTYFGTLKLAMRFRQCSLSSVASSLLFPAKTAAPASSPSLSSGTPNTVHSMQMDDRRLHFRPQHSICFRHLVEPYL